jgi:predicted DsbA family dithiol-disulfide isomerase
MGIQVEVFSSPGCNKCNHAREVLKKMTEELGGDHIQWKEVNVLSDLEYAVSLGVMSTPAIAIDGKLVFSGLPSAKNLKAELERRIAR